MSGDGDEAGEILRSAEAPRIAILDWMMPELHGVEVLSRLRAGGDETPAEARNESIEPVCDAGVPALRRDVFLDFDRSTQSIAREFAKLKAVATRHDDIEDDHVRRIDANVREAGVAVIGGGPGGYPAALEAAAHGLDVALISDDAKLGGAVFALSVIAAWGLCQVFSGRGAYMHVGAVLGTIMAANVWVRIIPAQRTRIPFDDRDRRFKLMADGGDEVLLLPGQVDLAQSKPVQRIEAGQEHQGENREYQPSSAHDDIDIFAQFDLFAQIDVFLFQFMF